MSHFGQLQFLSLVSGNSSTQEYPLLNDSYPSSPARSENRSDTSEQSVQSYRNEEKLDKCNEKVTCNRLEHFYDDKTSLNGNRQA